MNEKDLRIKRTWLLMLWLMPVFFLGCFVFFYANYTSNIPPEIEEQAVKKIVSICVQIGEFFFFSLILIPLMLYFSYKKQGSLKSYSVYV